ncbi:MAG: hypothetical protein WA705_03065 [Candidatus Ozemobacteraceae bacterium]
MKNPPLRLPLLAPVIIWAPWIIWAISCLLIVPPRLVAAVHNPTCVITSPTDLTKSVNSGQIITLSATWLGDTPPFAAVFKTGTAALGTINTLQPSAAFSMSAASLGGGAKNFSVNILETAVPNGEPSGDTPAPGTVTIDQTPPSVALSVVSGSVVSPATGFNEVIVQFTSSEALGEAPKFTVSPGTWPAPSPVSPESEPFSSNQYKITVPAGTAAGMYTVRAIARDNTEPAATRNEGANQTAFSVDTSADGTPTILSCKPPSPSRIDSVLLSGSVTQETAAQKVEILDGTSIVSTIIIAPAAETWTASINSLTEGAHKFSARRIDPLGNTSPAGAEFPVSIDLTPPARPILDSIQSPVNTSKMRISGTGVVDPPHFSIPLRMELTRGGTLIASAVANADGSFAFLDVPLVSGNNMLIAQAFDAAHDGTTADRGNASNFSDPVFVKVDQSPPVIISGGGIIISSLREKSDFQNTFFPVALNGEPQKNRPLSSTRKQARSAILRIPNSASSARLLENYHLLAYRRIYAPRQMLPQLQYILATHNQTGIIELRELVVLSSSLSSPSLSYSSSTSSSSSLSLPSKSSSLSWSSPSSSSSPSSVFGTPTARLTTRQIPPEAPPGFAADLSLLRAGKLPCERLDLMLEDIVSGRIPTALLPDPMKIGSDPRLRTLRDAIRFRRIHESAPLPAIEAPRDRSAPAIPALR